MKTIRDLEVSGKRLLIRVDFNVPLDKNGSITDDSRIRSVLPTLDFVLSKGARVILASHLGRPKGERVPELSLGPVAARLEEIIGKPVKLSPDCVGAEAETLIGQMAEGDVIVLENLRFHPEEGSNDPEFAKQLAGLCDIYVNDAFAVSHRVNASTVAVAGFAPVSAAGMLLQKEVEYFKKAMTNPKRPLVAIVGGAKISTKMGALKHMLQQVDKIIIGGAMANTLLKCQGIDVGASKVEDDLLEEARDLLRDAEANGIQLYLPVDVVAAPRMENGAPAKAVPAREIPAEWMALDIGPASTRLFSEVLDDAKTIVWSGPMGAFELDAFSRGTFYMVERVADSHALSIIGGGDTDLAVHQAGEADRISYISTGGGAFLTQLEGKTLPGVAALEETVSAM